MRSRTGPGNGANTAALPAQPSIQTNVPLAPRPRCADVCRLSVTSLWQSVLRLSSSPSLGADVNDVPEARRDGLGYPARTRAAAKGLRAGTG